MIDFVILESIYNDLIWKIVLVGLIAALIDVTFYVRKFKTWDGFLQGMFTFVIIYCSWPFSVYYFEKHKEWIYERKISEEKNNKRIEESKEGEPIFD